MKKVISQIVISLTVTGVVLTSIFIIGNNYQFKEEKIAVKIKNKTLSSVIVTPKKGEVKGVIFFVHGDGPQNATQDGGYYPIMERFAKQGFASVSWDKQGVGQSSGNWLDQSMQDRANEVSDVIDWTKKNRPELSAKIGLWGASQAGWVIPKVDKMREDIQFSILLAPGVNWLSQSTYFTENQAKNNGKNEKEIQTEIDGFQKDSDLILEKENYEIYLKAGGTSKMTEDRYQFVKRSMTLDATNDLKKMNSNVHLILGEKDKNVNSKDTEKAYRKNVNPDNLTVKMIKNAEHRMVNPSIANSEFLMTITAVFLPKYYLVSEEFLNYSEKLVRNE
ncbi:MULTISPECIES: alpha/beta hydrolase [Vagococcus]|uniref:Serine aminopeptidase S33 domain-containing protein n=1 Tax=Vagococcus fluvialis bH819 TaxID=1255619 RepID=A0A1X6WNG4_9ENTE|nr:MULTISPECIES: alpha/beta hydrolase [Vagococcus]SLM85807.1 hypothetical protein FM121_06880 [Vagococcus fluvialis bH819]HCM90229.1 alpha/beta hydrolase [Vagococcus sp.]